LAEDIVSAIAALHFTLAHSLFPFPKILFPWKSTHV